MTQLQEAKVGVITDAMRTVAEREKSPPETVLAEMAAGRAVIPFNPSHKNCRPVGVGRIFSTKINANLGCSKDRSSLQEELSKLDVALKYGADFVMDLTVGKDVSFIRGEMLKHSPVPLGTVPIYETVSRLEGSVPKMDMSLLLDVIEEQAEQGVDFMTLHAGLLRRHIPLAMKRVMGIVSRGGSLMAEWMLEHDKENPLYENWDKVLDILVKHDVTVSLGDGLRPGCLADASDEAQFEELSVLGELVKACRERGVQVMVEGPGHIPFNEIKMNMEKEQELCFGAPFYVLGPVVTDIAPGYDHLVSAIGATAAATYGASLLCYVTPAEHLGLPTEEDVKQGCVAYKIAAHAGDVARGFPGAADIDLKMSEARKNFDWDKQFECALDPETAKARWMKGEPESHDEDHCTMCGKEFCAVRTTKRIKELLAKKD